MEELGTSPPPKDGNIRISSGLRDVGSCLRPCDLKEGESPLDPDLVRLPYDRPPGLFIPRGIGTSGLPSLYRRTILGGVECELSASDGGEDGSRPSRTVGGTDGE